MTVLKIGHLFYHFSYLLEVNVGQAKKNKGATT